MSYEAVGMGWEHRGHCTFRDTGLCCSAVSTCVLHVLFGDPAVLWPGEEILCQIHTGKAGMETPGYVRWVSVALAGHLCVERMVGC